MNAKRIIPAVVSIVFLFTALAPADPNSFPICTAAGSAQTYPAVSGTYVVWQDNRSGGYDIYRNNGTNMKDANSFLVCNATRNQQYPAISGTTVVWQDFRPSTTNSDIYRYLWPSGPETAVCTTSARQENPAISGDVIVWHENGDIYRYKISDESTLAICINSFTQSFPAISGNMVVWQDARNGGMDIYGKNLDTGIESAICISGSWKQNAAISGNIVVWQDNRSGNWDIYGKNIATGEDIAICTDAGDQISPAISGDIVVWEDQSGSNTNIYGYRISAHTVFPICTRAGNQKNPAIDGSFVVWEEYYYDTTGDIYGAYIPEPVASSFITVIDPNGGEMLLAGAKHTITWQNTGTPIARVKIEYSKDANNWLVAEVNTPATGQYSYEWQVPSTVDSNQCKIKITDAAVPPVTSDTSDHVFTIFKCKASLTADLSGDCKVDFTDFAIFSGQWLDCGNPRDENWCP